MPGLSDRRALRATALALPVAVGAAVLTFTASSAAPRPAAPAPAPAAQTGITLTPRSITVPPKRVGPARSTSRLAAAAAAVPQLPTWRGSFRYASAHKTYRYTMVGTDPAGPAATTTVGGTVTPLSLRFSDKHVVSASSTLVRQVRNSGLYTNQAFPGGRGQYGDVYMRTQFWPQVQSGRKNWHVKLSAPRILPALSRSVPANKGGKAKTTAGRTVYLVDAGWLDNQLQGTVAKAQPSQLTQFLGGDVVLCGRYSAKDFSSCGIGGYHSYGDAADGQHTYLYSSYISPRTFGTKLGIHGLMPLSHEIAEWLTDPFVNNSVPRWTEPSVPQYGCSSVLEVGDPLVGYSIKVKGFDYQDEAYVSYFSRPKTSTSWLKRYTWFNSFKRYSKSC